jgi:NitT/TauT family transport system substrate-binding protein
MIAAVACIGAGLIFWLPAVRTESSPLRLGVNPWPGYEALFLAHKHGLFHKHGLDVQLVEFTSVGDCLRGYQEGNIDAMASTLIEVALADSTSAQGAPVPILVTDVSEGADFILAKPMVKSVADLKGRRIGVEPASLGMYILERALAKHGLTRADVFPTPMGQEEMRSALASDRVSAIVTYAPYSVDILKDGAEPLFTTREIPNEVLDAVSISPAALARFPGAPAAFVAVWADALAILERDRDESIAAMAARQRITPAEFVESMNGLRLIPADAQEALLAPDGALHRSLLLARKTLDVR